MRRCFSSVLDQALEDVAEDGVVGSQVVIVRVHRRGLGRQPDLEFLAEAAAANSTCRRQSPELAAQTMPISSAMTRSVRYLHGSSTPCNRCRICAPCSFRRLRAGRSNDVVSSIADRQQRHPRRHRAPSSRIESPTSDPAGVNRVLDVIAAWFEAPARRSSAAGSTTGFGDMLRVRCHPGRNEPGILVLSHVDTVHPLGTLAQALPVRREGDKVYGPGMYDMKGGPVLAIAAWQRLARAEIETCRCRSRSCSIPTRRSAASASRKHIEAKRPAIATCWSPSPSATAAKSSR